MTSTYRGRFAPTPSGPLHLGSLQTALASYLTARHRQGVWLLRMDDLDQSRCSPAAADRILWQLETHGLQWDEAVYRQSDHREDYCAAIARLAGAGRLYRCDCSRARLAASARPGRYGRIYDGRCRSHAVAADAAASLRMRMPTGAEGWHDAGCGWLEADLARDIGDFIVRRRDQVPGYQLACAVDEGLLGITEVVRGADLIGSTFCQQAVLRALQQPAPAYHHLPLCRDAAGRKLSKQNHAPPLPAGPAAANLMRCLHHLGQPPPDPSCADPAEAVLGWALAHWDATRIPAPATAPGDSDAD